MLGVELLYLIFIIPPINVLNEKKLLYQLRIWSDEQNL